VDDDPLDVVEAERLVVGVESPCTTSTSTLDL
jgi:hypothetical protein